MCLWMTSCKQVHSKDSVESASEPQGDKILGRQPCEEHPTTRQKRHLVNRNVLLRKTAPQMAACTGTLQADREP